LRPPLQSVPFRYPSPARARQHETNRGQRGKKAAPCGRSSHREPPRVPVPFPRIKSSSSNPSIHFRTPCPCHPFRLCPSVRFPPADSEFPLRQFRFPVSVSSTPTPCLVKTVQRKPKQDSFVMCLPAYLSPLGDAPAESVAKQVFCRSLQVCVFLHDFSISISVFVVAVKCIADV
jgi:hypothetical protein